MADSADEATRILVRLRGGDRRAADELLPLVYEELHRLAARYMRGQTPAHTLQATALVHEAYLRLVNQNQTQPVDRLHFISLAARAMRSILVDHARGRRASKRGGGRRRIPLDDALDLFENRAVDLVALDEALKQLAEIDERQSSIVELRFFGGLTAEETAQALGVSTRTVERDWRHARAWMYNALAGGTTSRQVGDDW